MIIKAVLRFGGDIIEVIVENGSLMFLDTSSGTLTTIEGLKLNKSGVVKEFPDLENNQDWQKIAKERFKEHFKTYKSDTMKLEYIVNELKNHGYTPLYKQRAGFRPERYR